MKKKKVKLCIFTPFEGQYSETFIKNHIDYLDAEKFLLFGTDISTLVFNAKPLLIQKWFNRIKNKIYTKVTGDKNFLFEKILIKFLVTNKIQVVLAEYGPSGVLINKACKKTKIPLIVHFHGYDASVYNIINDYKISYKYLFQSCYAIISVSKSMNQRLIDLEAPKNKIHLNPYGINTDIFNFNYKENYKYFLSVGRFVDKKAPHLTILAFYNAYRKDQSIKLKMVGDGPLLAACQILAKALKIDNSIEFLGVKTSVEIADLMQNATAFLQHSIISPDGNAEGTPLAILEAGACGLPVISTKHEGILDVINSGTNGILTDEFDIEGMGNAILQIKIDTKKFKKMREMSRENIQHNYNLKKHISILQTLICDAAQN